MSALIGRGPRAAVVFLLAGIASACKENLTDPRSSSPSSPDAPVQQGGPFHPPSSVTLARGSYSWSDVDIPSGVTITVSGDVTIKTSGDFNLAGKITGDCIGVSIVAGGRLKLGGAISNACSAAIPDAGAPAMRLVGLGGYTVDHGSATTSGPFAITNDTALTDSSFAAMNQFRAARAPSAARVAVTRASAAASAADTGVPCLFVQGVFTASPMRRADGASGKHGLKGVDGDTWYAACAGDMAVVGEFDVMGQSGGNGGAGRDNSASADASGGPGGKGGTLKLLVAGDLTFEEQSSTTLTSGSGGDGGLASAFASAPGGLAKAIGGNGAAPGLVEVRTTGDLTLDGVLNIAIGQGGEGGAAFASAMDGGAPCPTQAGGSATATGGSGGSTPDKSLKAVNVGGTGTVKVSGGEAGKGGDAAGDAGNGSDGAKNCKNGAVGGSLAVNGGKGGDALLKDLNGAYIADGGDGGKANFSAGNGGDGYDGCGANPPDAGGNGGQGGSASGNSGLGGQGRQNGAPGDITIDKVGNGGDGGDGNGPGSGGQPGANTIGHNGVVTLNPPSFQKGMDGKACPPPPPPPPAAPPKLGMQLQPLSANAVAGTTSLVHVVVTITRTNFDGPVSVSPGALPAGVTVNPMSQTVPAGQSQAAFDLTIQEGQAMDLTVAFTAVAAINGATVSALSTLPIHVAAATAGEALFNVEIGKAMTAGNDANGVDALLGVALNKVIGLQGGTVNNQPVITVDHLVVGGVSVVLTNSGPTIIDPQGNFTVSGTATIGMGSHGTQPIRIAMQAQISESSTGVELIFTLVVAPQSSATFQFGSVTYVGSGTVP